MRNGARLRQFGWRLGVSAAVTMCVGCNQAPSAPNVVVVTFDTTRADHIGAYGYPHPTTPNIDRLAERGTRFTRAYTTNPITLPSHTSLFTGTYPVHHGVRDNSAFRVRDDLVTLGEVLTDEGYDTAAFVGAFVLDSQFNLDQGFAIYDDEVERDWSRDELERRAKDAFGFSERKANLVTTAALRWLENRDRDRPFFTWLHYFDPHEPKNPPEPHRSIFSEPYDAEIAIADEQVGVFLEALREQGVDRDTWIIFTADHGEGLLDHGEPTHSLLVFNSTMHVPLIIRPPGGQEPEVDDRVASIVDIMPTILDRLDLPIPDAVQGRSLLAGASWGNRRAVYMESLVGRLQHGWGDQRALRAGAYKLIHGPTPRLYNVEDDPDEVFDRARQEPEMLETMTRELESKLAEWSDPAGAADARAAADEETLKKLASLGYLGQTTAPESIAERLEGQDDLVDPYTSRHIFDLAGFAQESIRKGDVLRGIGYLEEILASDPDNAFSLTMLGNAYVIHGRRSATAESYLRRAVVAEPRNEQARYLLARLLIQQGNLEEGQAQCESILAINPSSLVALYELGRVYEQRGDLEKARSHFEGALDVDGSNVGALLALGLLHARQRRNDRADHYLKRAAQQEPANPEVLYNQGVLYLQASRLEASAESLRLALVTRPDDGDAQYVLARVLVELERWDEASSTIDAALRLNTMLPARMEQLQRWRAVTP